MALAIMSVVRRTFFVSALAVREDHFKDLRGIRGVNVSFVEERAFEGHGRRGQTASRYEYQCA